MDNDLLFGKFLQRKTWRDFQDSVIEEVHGVQVGPNNETYLDNADSSYDQTAIQYYMTLHGDSSLGDNKILTAVARSVED